MEWMAMFWLHWNPGVFLEVLPHWLILKRLQPCVNSSVVELAIPCSLFSVDVLHQASQRLDLWIQSLYFRRKLKPKGTQTSFCNYFSASSLISYDLVLQIPATLSSLTFISVFWPQQSHCLFVVPPTYAAIRKCPNRERFHDLGAYFAWVHYLGNHKSALPVFQHLVYFLQLCNCFWQKPEPLRATLS